MVDYTNTEFIDKLGPSSIQNSDSPLILALQGLRRAIKQDLEKVKLLEIMNSKQCNELSNTVPMTVDSPRKRVPPLRLVISDPSSSSNMQEEMVSNVLSEPNETNEISASCKSNQPSPTYWYLIRKGYTKKNASFLLRHDVSSFFYVGRGPDCDFQCKAGNISRIHFKLICEKTKTTNDLENVQWSIQDLGSLTGTYLNGKKLSKDNEYLLIKDDVITLGKEAFSSAEVPKDKYKFVYEVSNGKVSNDTSC